MSIIFHIDVNSAFLSWTASRRLQEDPASVDLRTIPSIIGGDEKQRHGVVLAKVHSRRSAMVSIPANLSRPPCGNVRFLRWFLRIMHFTVHAVGN